ncbi:BsuPI-related putative proteinase inhibitor [Candidatus Latescibacterota bacterium]
MRMLSVFFSFIMLVFPIVAGADTTELEMDIFMPDSIFTYGEDVSFTVNVYNPTDSDITLEFKSSIQIDYMIGRYRYSSNHGFTDVLTNVTIPAKDLYKWEFIHTPKDIELHPGWHGLEVQLLGTALYAKAEFVISENVQFLPEGIVLSVDTLKDTYDPGEPPEFTVMARNVTDGDISLMIDSEYPIRYYVLSEGDDEIRYPDVFNKPDYNGTIIIRNSESVGNLTRTEPVEVIVPAGDARTWNGKIMEERLLLGGAYSLFAGFYGYGDEVSCKFTVNNVIINGTISGTVMTYAKDSLAMLTLGSATIDLIQYSPYSGIPEESITKYPESTHWTSVTDENGYFIINDVPVGYYYNLTITKDGYYPYLQSFITYYQDTTLQPVLKPEEIHTDNPLNFKRSTVGDLVIVMGTEWSVYENHSDFKASLSLTNTGDETVYFSFDNGYFVNWLIRDKEGAVVWESTQSDSTFIDSREVDWKLELSPGETHEFSYINIVSNMLSGHLGKYEFHAELTFTESSDERLTQGDIGDSVGFVVDTVFGREIEVKTVDNEYIVDLVDSLNTEVLIEMKDDEVRGEMCITELSENHHKALDNHRFVKMIKIDADYSIRSAMNNANVKIYFKADDFENPENLVIAHWKESDGLDTDLPGTSSYEEWEILESRVDLENGYVEAVTSSFSSFGLFEAEKPTVINDDQMPDMFFLGQNRPNPFNPTTTIQFNVPSSGNVRLIVYNNTGQKVATLVDGNLSAGKHQAFFDGNGLASGVYFYRITGSEFTATKRMLMIK